MGLFQKELRSNSKSSIQAEMQSWYLLANLENYSQSKFDSFLEPFLDFGQRYKYFIYIKFQTKILHIQKQRSKLNTLIQIAQ